PRNAFTGSPRNEIIVGGGNAARGNSMAEISEAGTSSVVAGLTAPEKRALYEALAVQLAALLDGENDPIANAANTAALIYHGLPELNWAGFYFRRGDE